MDLNVLKYMAFIKTVETGSFTKAAEKLNLHKNTLLYRMKQLYQTLELEQDTVFVREFFIRMLLEYRNMPESGKSPNSME